MAGPCHSGLGEGSSPAQTPALPGSLAQNRGGEEGIFFGFVFSQKHSGCWEGKQVISGIIQGARKLICLFLDHLPSKETGGKRFLKETKCLK